MNLTDILYEKRDDHIAVVTFNRPDSLNAFRQNTFREMNELLAHIEADDSIRAVIFTGTGRAFCAGEDLKELDASLTDFLQIKPAREHVLSLQAITRRVTSSRKIMIAALNGIAVGYGAELAIACDIRYAAPGAEILFAEAARGLFQTNGVMYLLPRIIGNARTLEMMVTAERVGADDLVAMGLVSRVLPADQLLPYALERARMIAANAPISVRLVKQVLRRAGELDLESVMGLEVDGVMECFASEDVVEGALSFVEKRPAVWKGK